VGDAIAIRLSSETPKFSESQSLSTSMATHEAAHAPPLAQPTSRQLATGEVKRKLTALHGEGVGRACQLPCASVAASVGRMDTSHAASVLQS
jgi:hypothetical protein